MYFHLLIVRFLEFWLKSFTADFFEVLPHIFIPCMHLIFCNLLNLVNRCNQCLNFWSIWSLKWCLSCLHKSNSFCFFVISVSGFLHIPNQIFKSNSLTGWGTSRITDCMNVSVSDAWGIGDLNFNPNGTHQKDTNPACLLAPLHSTHGWNYRVRDIH